MRIPFDTDWDDLGERMLRAAADALADAARARAGAAAEAISVEGISAHAARIVTRDPALIGRAQGRPGQPSEPILAPTAADLAEARACMIRILQGDAP